MICIFLAARAWKHQTLRGEQHGLQRARLDAPQLSIYTHAREVKRDSILRKALQNPVTSPKIKGRLFLGREAARIKTTMNFIVFRRTMQRAAQESIS